MKKRTILFGFSRFKNAGLSVKAHHIVVCMDGNANFTTTANAANEVAMALSDFDAALQAVKDDKDDRKAKRVVLEMKLSMLAHLVIAEGRGDPTILSTSGYTLRGENGHNGMLAAPANFRVTSFAGTGSVRLNCGKVKGAVSYLFWMTEAPVTEASDWTMIPSSKASCRINNLTKGKEYAFRVAAVGADPTLVYSDIITRYAS